MPGSRSSRMSSWPGPEADRRRRAGAERRHRRRAGCPGPSPGRHQGPRGGDHVAQGRRQGHRLDRLVSAAGWRTVAAARGALGTGLSRSTDGGNLHGGRLLSVWRSATTTAWHIDAANRGRPPHQFEFWRRSSFNTVVRARRRVGRKGRTLSKAPRGHQPTISDALACSVLFPASAPDRPADLEIRSAIPAPVPS